MQSKDDFIRLISGTSPFVDKSLFIRDFLDNGNCVQVITRPPGFGKTLNLSMLYHFLSINHKNESNYFKNLKIWQQGDKYRLKKGAYPVIYLSFKDCHAETIEAFYEYFENLIASLYREHLGFLPHKFRSDFLARICEGRANRFDLIYSLKKLCEFLHEYYTICPIILIDDYDKAFWIAAIHGYCEAMKRILYSCLAITLKDNNHMQTSVLMGASLLPAPQVFSGLNNVTLYDVFTTDYDSYFGFTRQEILNNFQGVVYDMNSLERNYGGYRIGRQVLVHPRFVGGHSENDRYEHFLIKKFFGLANNMRAFVAQLFECNMLDMENQVWSKYRLDNLDINDVMNILLQMGYLTTNFELNSRYHGQCYIPNRFSLNLLNKFMNNDLDHCSVITKHSPIIDGIVSFLDKKSAQSLACVSRTFNEEAIARKNRFFTSENREKETVHNDSEVARPGF